MEKIKKNILFTFFLSLSIFIFSREFFLSDFNKIIGNVGDPRYTVLILEHWFLTFKNLVDWNSPIFFYPEQNTLSYSDSLFLISLPYSFFRLFNIDIFLSLELTMISMQILGFVFMYLLLKKIFSFLEISSLLGATIFTISQPKLLIASNNQQFFSFVFVPLIIYSIISFFKYSSINKRKSYIHATTFAFFLPLLFFTCFKIGWTILFIFLTFFLIIFSFLIYYQEILKFSKSLWKYLKKIQKQLIFLFSSIILFSIPFLLLYLPMFEYSKIFIADYKYIGLLFRGFDEIINLGSQNFFWGGLVGDFQYTDYYLVKLKAHKMWPLGLPYFFLFLILVGIFYLLQDLNKNKLIIFKTGEFFKFRLLLLKLSALLFLLYYIFTVNFYGMSLWWFIYKYIIGANIIRQPSYVIIHLLVFFGVVISLFTLELFYSKIKKIRFLKQKNYILNFFSFFVISLLIIEEINTKNSHMIDRKYELFVKNNITAPPDQCDCFYITNVKQGQNNFYYQIQAMIIAYEFFIPTFNGYSGLGPEGWELQHPDKKDYVNKINNWKKKHHFFLHNQTICQYDLINNKWVY